MNKLIVCFLFLATCAWAQTNTPPVTPTDGVGGQGLLLALIPLVVPIIVAVAKHGLSWLPSWSLPIVAAALGELLNYVSGLAGGPTTTVINGVLLGSAGVGLREIVDQVRSKITTKAP